MRFLILALLACAGCSTPPSVPGGPKDAGSIDVLERDISVHSDVVEEQTPLGNDEDAAPYLPQFDPVHWETQTCEGLVEIPPVTADPFVVPDRDPPVFPVRTASEQRQLFPAANGNTLLAPAALEPGPEWVYDLFASEPQDVQLYFYDVTSRTEDELAAQRTMFTLLVDYKPVRAVWTRWDDERLEPIATSESYGFSFDVPRNVEIVDIKVPAAAFPERRAYEISLGVQSTSTLLNSERSSRRLVLYNGGYQTPPRPCAIPALWGDALPIERHFFGATGGPVLLFSEHNDDFAQLTKQPTFVEPGTTVKFYATLFRRARVSRVTALQPAVNGVPFGDVVWLTQGGANTQSYPFVDGRFTFEYKVPNEPGLYEVVVYTWEDPFETFRDLDGNRVPNKTSNGSVARNSNSIRLVVRD